MSEVERSDTGAITDSPKLLPQGAADTKRAAAGNSSAAAESSSAIAESPKPATDERGTRAERPS
jgi:hypothetical protein